MKIPVIKQLVEKYELADLQKAEENIFEEKELEIEVDGEDDGEKLTHISAAIWIKDTMDKENLPLAKALRAYTQRIRDSIS